MDVWVTCAWTLENRVSKFFSLISLISSIWKVKMKFYVWWVWAEWIQGQTWLNTFLISLNCPSWDLNMNTWMSELPEHKLMKTKFQNSSLWLVWSAQFQSQARNHAHVWWVWAVQIQSLTWCDTFMISLNCLIWNPYMIKQMPDSLDHKLQL